MSRRKQAKPIRLQDDGNPPLNGKNIFIQSHRLIRTY